MWFHGRLLCAVFQWEQDHHHIRGGAPDPTNEDWTETGFWPHQARAISTHYEHIGSGLQLSVEQHLVLARPLGDDGWDEQPCKDKVFWILPLNEPSGIYSSQPEPSEHFSKPGGLASVLVFRPRCRLPISTRIGPWKWEHWKPASLWKPAICSPFSRDFRPTCVNGVFGRVVSTGALPTPCSSLHTATCWKSKTIRPLWFTERLTFLSQRSLFWRTSARLVLMPGMGVCFNLIAINPVRADCGAIFAELSSKRSDCGPLPLSRFGAYQSGHERPKQPIIPGYRQL